MTRARIAGAALLALVAAAATSANAQAQEIGAPALSAAELADMRGGFMLPMGIEANFGAVARTYSDGVLVLETHFTWSPDGIVREDVLASSQLTATDQLAGGFVLEDASGQTLFAHQMDDSGVRNLLLNQADGRNLRIDTQFTVTLPNFALTQHDFSNARLALRLFEDLQAISP
jgi:hypothetical protein